MDVTDTLLSESTGRSLYQGHAGPCGTGDPAGLYPWLPFLSGRDALSSDHENASLEILKQHAIPDAEKYRT